MVKQYFSLVLFVFYFYSVCNFGKFLNFGLGTIRNERVNNNRNFLNVIGALKVLYFALINLHKEEQIT